MGRRRSNGVIRVDVDIDISDVLDDLSDQDLIEKIRSRKLGPKAAPDFDMLDPIRTALMRNRPGEALALLESLMFPKFRSAEEATAKLQAILALA